MSQEASLAIIAICCLLSVVAFVAVVVAAVLFVYKTKKSIVEKVDPILADAKAISTQAKDTVEGIAARVDSIGGRSRKQPRS